MSFWEDLTSGMVTANTTSIDNHLSKSRDCRQQVRLLTDKGREILALKLPAQAGMRVAFDGNIGTVFTYDDVPDPNHFGTVVTVRTATGDTTHHDNMVFVKWDDGRFIPTYREHLRPVSAKTASSFRRRLSAASFDEFLKTSSNELIHKATRDIWSLQQDGDDFVISRLFDETGEPLKY